MSTILVPVRWLAVTPETTGGAALADDAKLQIIDKKRSLVFIIYFWFR
jgi:hypothetical protein